MTIAERPGDLVDLSSIKTVRQVPYTEYFVSGHRTCQGCESALVMRYIAKAAGPRSVVLGSTGCMYVANTSYYTTPWVVPWMHTQLGSAGSAALGAAAGLKVLMRKGKLKHELINVIAFCGDGGGADMGLSAISAALTHREYNFLIILYDNESYANTDIQLSGSTPWRVTTSRRRARAGASCTRAGRRTRPGGAGRRHPDAAYIATADAGLRRGLHEQGAQGARRAGPGVHPRAGPVSKGLALRSAVLARAGQAGRRNRHLVAVGNGRPRGQAERDDARDCE
jgi:pyruvate ferredoxin oxidoreductase beta subunit